MVAVTAGVVTDMPEAEYHAHPALSVSSAKKLLPPYCPAIFRWEQEKGRPDKPEFDFGHAAHRLVLGVGADIVEIDATDWRTKTAQQQRDEARAAGQTPLLKADAQRVRDMAEALLLDPVASVLFEKGFGTPEVSLFWQDPRTDVDLRARLDWLPLDGLLEPSHDRLIIPDFKTAASANPARFAKSAADFGYHQQAAWYLDGVLTLGLADDAAFVFVVQEKTPPYLVSVVELDSQALRIGRHLNRQAIDVYAQCAADDRWPGYTDDVALVALPYWYARPFEEEL